MSKVIAEKLKKYLEDQLVGRNIIVEVDECPIVIKEELYYSVSFSDVTRKFHFSINYPAKKIL